MVQWHTEKKLYEGFHIIKLAKYHKIMHHLQLKYFVYISKENLLFSLLCCRQEWVDAHYQAHLQRSLHTRSLLRSLWHVTGFWVLSTAKAKGTSHNSLEWWFMEEQTHTLHQICVPVRLSFPAHAPLRAVPLLVASLPSLRADTPPVSQNQSVTKGNLTPCQPQGRFSELLQQLWPGLEAL